MTQVMFYYYFMSFLELRAKRKQVIRRFDEEQLDSSTIVQVIIFFCLVSCLLLGVMGAGGHCRDHDIFNYRNVF